MTKLQGSSENGGLVLAHQELGQLTAKSPEVASAVITNPATHICFRVGDQDGKRLAEGFSFFDAKDLQSLGIGEAICRIERADHDFNLRTLPASEVDEDTACRRRTAIVELSRKKYGRARTEIEAELTAKSTGLREVPSPESDSAAQTDGAPAEKPRQRKTRKGIPEGDLPATSPSLPGRGGQRHKYLLQLIQRWAESKGYQVAVEKPILDGLGSVDVALEREGGSIACEISVTTGVEHEVENIQKCLAAGFEHVVLVSSDKTVLKAAKEAASAALSADLLRRVRFLAPEQLFQFIGMMEAKAIGKPEAYPESKEVLTARELEDLLKLDVKTIYSYAQRGLLPYVKIQSNIRFLRSEILKWIEDHGFRPKPASSGK